MNMAISSQAQSAKRTHTREAAACNTLPPKYIRKGPSTGGAPINPRPPIVKTAALNDARGVRIVATGIDTVYASVKGELHVDRLADALMARAKAQEAAELEPWAIPGLDRTFLVQPHGRRGYAVHMNSPSLDVWLGYEGQSGRPTMYFELRSVGIHAAGIEAAVADAQDVAAWFIPSLRDTESGAGLTVSRIDIYADVQGWAPGLEDDQRFVCRGKAVGSYDSEMVDDVPRSRRRIGRTFSGFSFGRGRVVARVYNKTLQMKARGDDWQRAVWVNADPNLPVWRVEVQFRRAVLTDFRDDNDISLTTVADALDHRQELWDYGVGQWLTLRVPNSDPNRSRWPIDPSWRVIREAQIGSPKSPLVRRHVQNTSYDRLVQGMTGYLTSLAAHDRSGDVRREIVNAIESGQASMTDLMMPVELTMSSLTPTVASYLRRRERNFVAVVADKRRKNNAS